MKRMKANIGIIGFVVLGLLASAACTEISFGDDFLGSAPESSGSTLETMFASQINSEQVLTRAYQGLPYGLSYSNNGSNVLRMGGNLVESLTDLCQSFRYGNQNDGPLLDYYSGLLSANNVNSNKDMYVFGSNSDWATIKYGYIYLENIDRVPDMTEGEKNAKKAEAKTVIALAYFNMLRYIGGVIWIDHSIDVNDEMSFPRTTFAESVDHIARMLDEAIAEPEFVWKWDSNNDGRMSKASAMALKFKLLQFAASPMFNSATKWHPQADEYTCYGNYDASRWAAAAAAGKAFFDEINRRGGYALIQPEAPTHDARRQAYRKAYYDRGGTEILISLRKGAYTSDTYGGDNGTIYSQRYYAGPTLNYVEMFPWEDGTDFPADFNWEKPSKDPFFSDGSTVPTRDPRLYENVAVPGDIYFNGNSVPSYIPHPSFHEGSGFLVMKFILQQASDRANRPVQWPHTRLAEIMLGYAEVLNEVNNGPDAEAYKMVNVVRARVGLGELPKNLNHDQFFETVLRERACELGFEEVRWYDLIRWNRSQDFRKTLYGLEIRGNAADMATEFTYKKVELPARAWASNWDSKWYLSPIPQKEINKDYGMTQNPGW